MRVAAFFFFAIESFCISHCVTQKFASDGKHKKYQKQIESYDVNAALPETELHAALPWSGGKEVVVQRKGVITGDAFDIRLSE